MHVICTLILYLQLKENDEALWSEIVRLGDMPFGPVSEVKRKHGPYEVSVVSDLTITPTVPASTGPRRTLVTRVSGAEATSTPKPKKSANVQEFFSISIDALAICNANSRAAQTVHTSNAEITATATPTSKKAETANKLLWCFHDAMAARKASKSPLPTASTIHARDAKITATASPEVPDYVYEVFSSILAEGPPTVTESPGMDTASPEVPDYVYEVFSSILAEGPTHTFFLS
jgi:hypothetical protein